MPRRPRIEFPGALYHVIARGNQRRRTFKCDDGYEDYLRRLKSYHDKFRFLLYAYCLMPNHVHLLIETGDVPLSRIMQALQFSYTQSFNRRHRTIGHLFHGRYKAILCQRDEYLLQLLRYIHLNPVRAKLVRDHKDYVWSSHRGLMGLKKDAVCDTGVVLGLFGKRKKEGVRAYEAFVLEDLGSGHRKDLYHLKDQRILGDDEFAEGLIAKEDERGPFCYDVPLEDIVNAVVQEFGTTISQMKSLRRGRGGSMARGVVAYLAKVVAGISLKDVGAYFSRGNGTMSDRYRVIEELLATDERFKRRIGKVTRLLTTGRAVKIEKRNTIA